MIETLIISLITCVSLILSILLFPKVKILKKEINTYWIICLIGALFILLFKGVSLKELMSGLFADSSINPIKILILFFSMTFLSIFLDEVRFFKFIASVLTNRCKTNQTSLFFALYALVSVLTIFTSNDIVILTFTPFICYFCKNTKINPIPYLIGEFFAANTLSMTLIIGNPTNIYIASNAGITFMEYFSKMFIIGILTSILLCLILLLLFKKQLKQPLIAIEQESNIKSKFLLIVGLIHLISCTVIMAISNYINIPMYLVSLGFALSLIIITLIYTIVKKLKTNILRNSLHDLPIAFIPFLVSMVILISCLSKTEYIKELSQLLEEINSPILYGASSFFLGNLLNNIPMSILYSEIFASSTINLNAIYEVIAASNLCALFTPLGSLAGMMFLSLVKQQDIDFSFVKFIKYGFVGIILAIFAFALIILI